jgi:hypothetical protein
MKGPCVVCGAVDYPLSMGGANICPNCDCGDDPFAKTKAALGKFVAVHDEALKAVIEEKDAEIQRLKKLITELADWVRDHSYEGYPLPNIQLRELLQRAREATR